MEYKYFSETMSLEELKKKHRELSLSLHPDKGGNGSDFGEMQTEYRTLREQLLHSLIEQLWEKIKPLISRESASITNLKDTTDGVESDALTITFNTNAPALAILTIGYTLPTLSEQLAVPIHAYIDRGRKIEGAYTMVNINMVIFINELPPAVTEEQLRIYERDSKFIVWRGSSFTFVLRKSPNLRDFENLKISGI